MKAILLATLMIVVLFAAITLSFRFFPCEKRVRRMAQLFFGSAIALAGLWFVTPTDLSFIPPALLTKPDWLDLVLTGLFFSAAFFGGLLQLYNLADRGFSLRVLIDILESPGAVGTCKGLAVGYGGGKGLVWMYGKRIHGLLDGGLVVRQGSAILLTEKGARLASLFLGLRQFLRLGELSE